MNSKGLIERIFGELFSQVGNLSEADLLKIEEDTHELFITVAKKKPKPTNTQTLSTRRMEEVLKRFQECISREDGLTYISASLKNKSELEQFAKFIDVLVLKQDKADRIKNKIVEATIGAVLRTNAIQGRKYTNHAHSSG